MLGKLTAGGVFPPERRGGMKYLAQTGLSAENPSADASADASHALERLKRSWRMDQ